MRYLIYETTNLVDGKKYIGKHATNKIDDDYLGSGIYLKRAIRKYGKENFSKKILFECISEKEMNDKEIQLINDGIVNGTMYYNLAYGGQGGVIVLKKDHPLYEETCKKISQTKLKNSTQISKGVKELHKQKKVGMYGKKQSEYQKETVSKLLKGKKQTEEHKENHKKALQKTFSDPNYVHPNSGRKKKTKQCVHCKKFIDYGNFARYHGEKCKLKLKYEDAE
jgi:hypothetical protein